METGTLKSHCLDKIENLTYGFDLRYASDLPTSGLTKTIATVKQVHKAHLHWVHEFEQQKVEADAIATFTETPVGVLSADCCPILCAVSNKNTAYAVLAIHAGWRGTALQITAQAITHFVDKVKEHPQFSPSTSFSFFLGPCIQQSSFEVGQDVIDSFPQCLSSGIAIPGQSQGKYYFNLPQENENQVIRAMNIAKIPFVVEKSTACTLKEKDHLPSFRRDGSKAGRILSYIAFQNRV